MKNIYILFVLSLITTFGASAVGQERWLNDRLQLEGSFATTFNDDAGYNLNLNYTPSLPGALDGAVSLGAFWQWTFEADELSNDADIMKLGGELRLQKAFGSLVPYVKGEAGWIRFDNGSSVDKFGIGPGAGLNFWLTHNFGFGAEANTVFIFDRDDAPDKQITTFLVGPRIGF